MNIQTKASFKKEALSFIRTGRFFIIAIVFIGLAMMSPILLTGMSSFMNSMSDIYDSMGVDITGMTGMLTESSSLGVSSTVSDITGVGLIVYLLLINRAAGGEQKKRDVIIPRSAGLRNFSYLFPKYIIYPLTVFVLSVFAMLISRQISSMAFEIDNVTAGQAFLAGVLTGVYMMFYVCFHITLGTATGKAGMSAAICLGASILLPNIFIFTSSEYIFNPFALNALASIVIATPDISGAEIRDIVITICFALALLVLSYFIALFAQNAKRIDNTGNEMEL